MYIHLTLLCASSDFFFFFRFFDISKDKYKQILDDYDLAQIKTSIGWVCVDDITLNFKNQKSVREQASFGINAVPKYMHSPSIMLSTSNLTLDERGGR